MVQDEYVGIPRDHPESYHTFMFKNFFSLVDIKWVPPPAPFRVSSRAARARVSLSRARIAAHC